MFKLVSLVSAVPKGRVHADDDVADRLSHRYTTVMLAAFSVVLSMHQYIGSPVTCWAPKHFTKNHVAYTRNYCWVRNTYYLPFDEEIPKKHEEYKYPELLYYQWIPFILILQAVFFYLPTVVWRALNSKSGVDADNILDTAGALQMTNKVDSRDKTLQFITHQMDRFLGHVRGKKPSGKAAKRLTKTFSIMLCGICGKRFGNYLILLFLFVKVLFITNVFGQLYILNALLRTKYNVFGWEMLLSFINDNSLNGTISTVFPRVTMCNMEVRRLGNLHRYTLQCLLPINLYAEKVYIFLWFWMVFVLIASCLSLTQWLVRSVMNFDRMQYIQNHLLLGDRLAKDDMDQFKLSKTFVFSYLRHDGVFLLRLIGHNTNRITVTEIVGCLWDLWIQANHNNNPVNPPLPASALPTENEIGTYPKRRRPTPPPKPKFNFTDA